MKKLPPWSASSLDAFTTCPHKFYRLKVIKDVEDLPPGDAVILGRKLHKAFENAVNLGEPLPGEYKHWQSLVDKLRSAPGEKHAELWYRLDEDLQPCERANAWTWGVADLVIRNGKEVLIVDYKTGKRKPSDQLALYAAYAFAYYKDVERVHTCFIWLKERKMDKATYTRDDLPKIWAKFLPTVARLKYAYENERWEPRPSGLCKNWCPVKDCRFCGV
jgi:hypothetical protein